MAEEKKKFIDEDKRDFGGWWMWVVGLIAVSGILLGAANALGLIGYTAAERIVFEQSYQRSAAEDAKLATFKAQRAELEAQIRRQDIPESVKADYRAQVSALNIQIATIEGS